MVQPPYAHTVRRAREITGLGQTKLYDLINAKRLERVKVDGRTLITDRSIRELLGLDEEQEAA